MDELPPKRRRWFQFRLRTLLLAVVLLSLPLSWCAAKLERARRQRMTIEFIRNAGANVVTVPSAPGWLRVIVGDDLFVNVVGVDVSSDEFGDEDAAYLRELTTLLSLSLEDTQVTDTGLEHLKGISSLRALSLRNTQVTDTGLEHLRAMVDLGILFLGGTQVTNEGVKKLNEALPHCIIDY